MSENNVVDIEVSHLYLRDFKESRTLAPPDLAAISAAKRTASEYAANGMDCRFSLLIDDEEGAEGLEAEHQLIQQLYAAEGIQLQRIVNESSMVSFADNLISTIRPSYLAEMSDGIYLRYATGDRLLWAGENPALPRTVKQIFLDSVLADGEEIDDEYEQSSARFWVPLKLRHHNQWDFGCSLLTATWYLSRFGVDGFVENAEIPTRPKQLVNILSMNYLKSEAYATEILKLSGRKAVKKCAKNISYIFV